MEVTAFTEQYLGVTMDFAARVRNEFRYSWDGREELFRWKYLDQIHKLAGQDVPCWVAVEGGKVVGFLGSMVSDFRFAGEVMPGTSAMDLYLEDACRGKGVGKELLRRYEESARLKLMLVSSEQAHGIYLHRGYQDLPGVSARASIWSLRCATQWALRKFGITKYELEPPRPSEVMTEWLTRQSGVRVLDPRKRGLLDDFLATSQRRFSLAPCRTVDYLLWKYRDHPDRHGEVFTLTGEGGLSAIFAMANRKLAGPPMLAIGDIFLRDHDCERTVRIIVKFARELVGATGAHAAACFGCWELLDRAMRDALATRAQEFRCSLLVDDCDVQADIATSYISAGDGDYIR